MDILYPTTPVIMEGLSLRFLREYAILPLSFCDTELVVAMADPEDTVSLKALVLFAGKPVRAFGDERDRILGRIDQLYGSVDAILHQPDKADPDPDVSDGKNEGALRDQALEAPIVARVSALLAAAVEAGVSDIHLEPQERRFAVRFRIDGVLRERESPPKALERAMISRLKLLANMNIAERRIPQDGRFQAHVLGQDVDLRVATSPGLHGETLVIRLLTRRSGEVALGDLGLSAADETWLRATIAAPHGLVLVTGPTGSGKTTTLYCALKEMDATSRKIITLEDPIEYQLADAVQIAVRPDLGLSFAQGLRALVRQDPDVLMIGEIRDSETAAIAVQAALTGHLVLSTLHTNDALGAIARLQELGIAPTLLAASLKGVIAQRLVRRLCTACAKPAATDFPAVLAVGCSACDETGYRGRIGLFETLAMTPTLLDLLGSGASPSAYATALLTLPHRTLADEARNKIAMGLTTAAEVARVIGREEAISAPETALGAHRA
ncbi:MAG: GspE/PulE family protein [Acidiferrobacter sp.]